MNYGALVEDYWQEWLGEGAPEGTVWFYAQTHVDVFHPPVYRNLSRVLQQSGIPSSLQEAYRMIDDSITHESFAGYVDENPEIVQCDSYGYTESGDLVDKVYEVTIVEMPINV